MTVMWCMATPGDFIATVELDRVVAVRTSDDYRFAEDPALLWHWYLCVNRMAGALSHDFNNLLMVALAGAAELLEAEDLPLDLREIVEDVHQTTEQASALASRLTGVARSQPPLQGVTDLRAQVHSMRRAFARRTAGRPR